MRHGERESPLGRAAQLVKSESLSVAASGVYSIAQQTHLKLSLWELRQIFFKWDNIDITNVDTNIVINIIGIVIMFAIIVMFTITHSFW